MSIYSARPFSKIPGIAQKPENHGTQAWTGSSPAPVGNLPSQSDPSLDWAGRRRAVPANYLLRPALDWFKQLPLDVRPVSLADKYPRVVNLIVGDWNTPSACRARLEDLQSDRRGGRKGFAAEIKAELRVLRAYYDRSHLALQEEPTYDVRRR